MLKICGKFPECALNIDGQVTKTLRHHNICKKSMLKINQKGVRKQREIVPKRKIQKLAQNPWFLPLVTSEAIK